MENNLHAFMYKKMAPSRICKQVENKSASAKVRLQTTAELVKKDFSRFARQAQM